MCLGSLFVGTRWARGCMKEHFAFGFGSVNDLIPIHVLGRFVSSITCSPQARKFSFQPLIGCVCPGRWVGPGGVAKSAIAATQELGWFARRWAFGCIARMIELMGLLSRANFALYCY